MLTTSNTIKCCCALKLIISLIKLCHAINISCANFRQCHLSKTVTFPFRNLGTSGPCMLSCFSRVRLFVTLWNVACQAPLSMGFSRQKYWSGLPCPPPEDLSDPGIEPTSLRSPALEFFTPTRVLYH